MCSNNSQIISTSQKGINKCWILLFIIHTLRTVPSTIIPWKIHFISLIRYWLLPQTAISFYVNDRCLGKPNFYMLSKIHKPGNPRRTIIPAPDCPTEHLSEFLDIIFHVIADHPSDHCLRLDQCTTNIRIKYYTRPY